MYTDSTQTDQPVNIIIGATVGGVVVAVLLTIVIVVSVALLLLYWNRATKTQKKYLLKNILVGVVNTVEPPLTAPPRCGQPPYNGQHERHRLILACV